MIRRKFTLLWINPAIKIRIPFQNVSFPKGSQEMSIISFFPLLAVASSSSGKQHLPLQSCGAGGGIPKEGAPVSFSSPRLTVQPSPPFFSATQPHCGKAVAGMTGHHHHIFQTLLARAGKGGERRRERYKRERRLDGETF